MLVQEGHPVEFESRKLDALLNQILEEYSRHYVITAQSNWLELLEPAQLSYNLQRSLAIGMSPFEVSIRSEPCTPLGVLVSEQYGCSVSPTV